MNFLESLNNLETAAKAEITRLVGIQKCITLFEEDEDEWDVDIYDDIPDFAWFGNNNAEWAAVMELRENVEVIEITGILKGGCYPDKTTVELDQLDTQAVIYLAQYLTDRFS